MVTKRASKTTQKTSKTAKDSSEQTAHQTNIRKQVSAAELLAQIPVVQEEVYLYEIEHHPDNPRRGNVARIKDSIKRNGYYPTIFIQKSTRYIIKGNHTFKALKELNASGKYAGKFERVIVNVIDVTDEQALSILHADNRSSDDSFYDSAELYTSLKKLDETDKGLAGTGYVEEDLAALERQLGIATEESYAQKKTVDEDTGREQVTKQDIGDFKFPSDNDYDIPVLNKQFMADAIDLPVLTWGSQRGRKGKGTVGTWTFYTTDELLEPLWKDPTLPLNTKAVTCCEINFSVTPQTPKALAIYHIYRKRWLARFWQSKGMKILVDINMSLEYTELNYTGVPHGWRSYCTRGYATHVEDGKMMFDFERAVKQAGTKDILYLVVGGSETVKRFCAKNQWVWIPDEIAVSRGKNVEAALHPKGKLSLERHD